MANQSPRQSVSITLQPQLLHALDGLARNGQSRSDVINDLLSLAIAERAKLAEREREKRVTLSVRVKPETVEHLKNFARVEGESVNTIAALCIEESIKIALGERIDESAIDLLRRQLAIEVDGQRDEVAKQAHRFAHLITRSILENLQNRFLMAVILQQNGVSAQQISDLSETALTRSVDALRNPSPMMKKALEDLGVATNQSDVKDNEEI